jgi:hypothetical protein
VGAVSRTSAGGGGAAGWRFGVNEDLLRQPGGFEGFRVIAEVLVTARILPLRTVMTSVNYRFD